jgi:hypothetical protein
MILSKTGYEYSCSRFCVATKSLINSFKANIDFKASNGWID